jgi:hypothetical protein
MIAKKLKFSGHQTFAFRYGWLEKGFKFVSDNKNFNDDGAIVDLGVGKNMVESIKYWSEAIGILSDGRVTEFACSLLNENTGWDTFLEDNASLWLLHWKLITNSKALTAGSVIFSFLHRPEFSKRDVVEAIYRQLDQDVKKFPSESVILRDVDCYIRSYSGTRHYEKTKTGQESFDCPFKELGLIHPMSDAELYRFAIGPKISLPPEIIGYAVWDYLNSNQKRSSMRIQEALYHEYSPGQVFKLDENTLVEAINTLHTDPVCESMFSFTESAGIALIHCSLHDGDDLLEYYYKKRMLND